ncbi:unnamed protein product, partial [Nesidiocoris tenuis]
MLKYPKLYGQKASSFSVTTFWVWIGNAMVHSMLLFWLAMLAVNHEVLWKNGREGGYLMLGNMVYT